MKTRKRFQALIEELDCLDNIRLNMRRLTFYAPKKVRDRAREMDFPQQILAFYETSNGFELEWEMLHSAEPNILGRVNILPLDKVIQDWQGVVYFEDAEPDDPIRSFYPFDFFVGESCIGIYLDKSFGNSLYLYDFYSEPLRLDIDVFGYIELLLAARGFLYWQNTIKALITGTENVEADRFRAFMPQLFSDFSFERFASTYENLRLSKS